MVTLFTCLLDYHSAAMRSTKATVEATVNDVINLTSTFTPAVTYVPTASKATGNSRPEGILVVKFFKTEGEMAAIISALVEE